MSKRLINKSEIMNLIEQLKQGDSQKAFLALTEEMNEFIEYLVKKYEPFIVSCRFDEEDLRQEIITELYNSTAEFKGNMNYRQFIEKRVENRMKTILAEISFVPTIDRKNVSFDKPFNSLDEEYKNFLLNSIDINSDDFEEIENSYLNEYMDEVYERAEMENLSFILKDLMENCLKPKEREVLEFYFYNDISFYDVGMTYGCSGARISQIVAKSLRKLRRPSNLRKIKSFMYDPYYSWYCDSRPNLNISNDTDKVDKSNSAVQELSEEETQHIKEIIGSPSQPSKNPEKENIPLSASCACGYLREYKLVFPHSVCPYCNTTIGEISPIEKTRVQKERQKERYEELKKRKVEEEERLLEERRQEKERKKIEYSIYLANRDIKYKETFEKLFLDMIEEVKNTDNYPLTNYIFELLGIHGVTLLDKIKTINYITQEPVQKLIKDRIFSFADEFGIMDIDEFINTVIMPNKNH
jgi:RNA polymerase sigma factor (sigma-70 family)